MRYYVTYYVSRTLSCHRHKCVIEDELKQKECGNPFHNVLHFQNDSKMSRSFQNTREYTRFGNVEKSVFCGTVLPHLKEFLYTYSLTCSRLSFGAFPV